jgi:hypothetical protein
MTEGKLLSAAEIFAVDDVRYEDVYIEAWGGSVRLKTLDARTALKFFQQNEKTKDAMIQIVIKCAIDKDGNPLFKTEDTEQLKGRTLQAFQTLQEVAMRLNKLGKYSDLEEEKND